MKFIINENLKMICKKKAEKMLSSFDKTHKNSVQSIQSDNLHENMYIFIYMKRVDILSLGDHMRPRCDCMQE